MSRTNIEWADMSWPVVTGCSHAGSPGCDMCYAARMAATRLKYHPRYEGLATIENGKAKWTGEIRLNHDVLEQPLHWKKPRMVFVASMGDLFHEGVPVDYAADVFNIMARCKQHTFLLLTKRAGRALTTMDTLLNWDHATTTWTGICPVQMLDAPQPLSNVWLGVSVENQEQFDSRWYWASQIPAAVLFVSCEPLLDLVRFNVREWERLPDWVICGAESGPGARPMHPDWARSLRDQCQAADIPYFMKQWGAWVPVSQWDATYGRKISIANSGRVYRWPDGSDSLHVGKKRAGHLLDGRAWQEFPGGM